MEKKKCPMCGKEYSGYPAISRTKGGKEICSECGSKQAMTALAIASSRLYCTQGLYDWMKRSDDRTDFVKKCFDRHNHFDWGDMDAEDLRTNDLATVSADRMFSSYNISDEIAVDAPDSKIWIITEWDRSSTTVLFPSEY